MRKLPVVAGALVTLILSGAAAVAGPWEDGMVAYNRGLRVLTAAQFIRHAGFPQRQEFREAKCAPQGFSHPSHWP
jgi:hypothetical protein